MNTQKGNTMLSAAIIIAVLIIGGAMMWATQSRKRPVPVVPQEDAGTTENDAIQNAQQELLIKTGDMYQGQQIAGMSAPYLAFTQADYEKALAEGKIIFLDFYANWCPICRVEAPELVTGFNELATDQVVGFRVNYKDDETDADEKALAGQFNISYQHTKVILKNGQEISRSGESWDKGKFLEEIEKFL